MTDRSDQLAKLADAIVNSGIQARADEMDDDDWDININTIGRSVDLLRNVATWLAVNEPIIEAISELVTSEAAQLNKASTATFREQLEASRRLDRERRIRITQLERVIRTFNEVKDTR